MGGGRWDRDVTFQEPHVCRVRAASGVDVRGAVEAVDPWCDREALGSTQRRTRDQVGGFSS